MSYTIVIPNRYPDVIAPLLNSLHDHSYKMPVVIVADGHKESYGHHMIPYTDPEFQYSKAVNLGINWVIDHTQDDVVLLNDDCLLLTDYPFAVMSIMAEKVQPVGLISPLIRGCVGNPLQRYHEKTKWWRDHETIKLIWDPDPVCFPCVYLKRNMILEIGLLNEEIRGYGRDDNEYCTRARSHGWWTMIDSRVVIQHGDGKPTLGEGRGKSWSTSFARRYP
jgi:GT2 family glycosyltransferase